MSSSHVSIVIPTFDGIASIGAVLDAIAGQIFDGPVEIVAVDSGSSDGTVEVLRNRVDTLIEIAPADFNHGTTRNLGIEATEADLVVLLVQDAIPADRNWLTELVRPFADNPALAGSFARQLPHADASRLTRWSLARWAAAQTGPYISRIKDRAAFENMPPAERFHRCVFDNVCSCVRRSVWRDHPFPATAIAEDVEWGRDVLLAGYELAYVPESTVIHSHERSLPYEMDRTRLTHQRLLELFGLRTIPGVAALLRSVFVTLAEHLRCLATTKGPRPGFRGLSRAAALALIWPLGQFLGGRVT